MSLHIKFKHSPLQKNCQSISSQKLSSDPKATFFRGLLLSSSQKKRAKTKLCGLEFCALGCKVRLATFTSQTELKSIAFTENRSYVGKERLQPLRF